MFDSAAALTSGTTASANILDLGIAAYLFDGLVMCVLVIINTSANYGSSDETYEFKVISSAATNMGTPTVHVDKTINGNILVANTTYKLVLGLPVGDKVLRYLGLSYVLGGTSPTITVSSYFVPQQNVDKYAAYKAAYTID